MLLFLPLPLPLLVGWLAQPVASIAPHHRSRRSMYCRSEEKKIGGFSVQPLPVSILFIVQPVPSLNSVYCVASFPVCILQLGKKSCLVKLEVERATDCTGDGEDQGCIEPPKPLRRPTLIWKRTYWFLGNVILPLTADRAEPSHGL